MNSFIYRNLYRTNRLRHYILKFRPAVIIAFLDEAVIRALVGKIGTDTRVITSLRSLLVM